MITCVIHFILPQKLYASILHSERFQNAVIPPSSILTTRVRRSPLKKTKWSSSPFFHCIEILTISPTRTSLIRKGLMKPMVALKCTKIKEFSFPLAMGNSSFNDFFQFNFNYLLNPNRPRICLGMRFATFQSKAAIVEIIRNFDLSVNEETKLPFVFDPSRFLLTPQNKVWLDFRSL